MTIHQGEICGLWEGAKSFQARVALGTKGGIIEIHLDSPSGQLIGTAKVNKTGNWSKWKTTSCKVNGV